MWTTGDTVVIVEGSSSWCNQVSLDKIGALDEDMHRIITHLPPGTYRLVRVDEDDK